MHDSLYRNSIYLMLNTIALAIFGFVFWVIAAHFYSSKDVGLAATLLSVAGLICTLSLFGFDSTMIRFLARSEQAARQINTYFNAASIAAIVISCVYLILIRIFIPKLGFLDSSMLWFVGFVFFMIINMLNSLTNNVFIAFRISHIILSVNIIFGILRIVVLILLTHFALGGLIISNVLAATTAVALSLYLIKSKLHFGYKPIISLAELKKAGSYTFGNYLSNVIATLPLLVLPTLVLSTLGPNSSAYYYIVAVIIGVLYVIPAATSQSLFAEGSWNDKELKSHLVKATAIISSFMLPAIIILILFGKTILLIFGAEYAHNGYILMILMALAGIPKAVSYLFGTILRVNGNIKPIIIIYSIYALVVLGGSYWEIQHLRPLATLGLVILLGELITAFLFTITVAIKYGRLRVSSPLSK